MHRRKPKVREVENWSVCSSVSLVVCEAPHFTSRVSAVRHCLINNGCQQPHSVAKPFVNRHASHCFACSIQTKTDSPARFVGGKKSNFATETSTLSGLTCGLQKVTENVATSPASRYRPSRSRQHQPCNWL